MKKNWLEQNYEKAVLGVVGLICLIFGLKHILSARTFPDSFGLTPARPSAVLPDDESSKMNLSAAILGGSYIWRDQEISITADAKKDVTLLRSVWIIEHNDKLYDLTNPEEEQLRPPVENQWLLDHRLDLLSASVLSDDPDADGYSNLEEWESIPKTNPVDSKSHPPYTDKLLFVSRQQQSFFLTFAANNKPQFQINTVDRRGNRESGFHRVGDSFAKGRFEVVAYRELEGMRNGIKQDISELDIKDTLTDRTFALVRREKKNWPTYYAEFNFTLAPEQSQFYVREGESFTLNLEPGRPYKLLAVTETEATIQSAGQKPIVLPKGALTIPGDEVDDF